MIGVAGVGKTSISERWKSDKFDDNKQREDTFLAKVGQNIKVCAYSNISNPQVLSFAIANSQALLGIYSIADKESFKALSGAITQARKKVPLIPIVLIGNKSDLNTRQVSWEAAHSFANEVKAFFCETSARSGSNVQLVRDLIVRIIQEGFHEL